jgi:hypothetical protein
MISLPLNLVPNRVKIVQLPATQRAEGLPQDGMIESSISLSDVATQGIFDLVFENYPVKPLLMPGYGSAITPGVNCGIDQAGWVGAWNFYRNITKDGHYAFVLPPAHALWDRIEFEAEWLANGLNGLPAVYRIIERPLLSGEIQRRGNFNLRIRQSLRTPKHI